MIRRFSVIALTAAFLAVPVIASANTVWLSTLDLSTIEQDWGSAHANLSVEGHPLKIGGRSFDRGIGTHANSSIPLELDGNGTHFSAWVGVDDETGRKGSVVFHVVADKQEVWNSGTMRGGDAPKEISLVVTNVQSLALRVSDNDDGIEFDHADWADAKVEMSQGAPRIRTVIRESAIILTPPSSPEPRIHGARVFGVRPGSPFLFTIAATGDRPTEFSADGLPPGLALDQKTGHITGQLKDAGEYPITLRAKNKLGSAERSLKIICGPQIGLTPAMGWNSWNCFADSVTEQKIKAAADAMVSSGLVNHGWTYINIDDYWQIHRDSKDPTLQGPQRDAQERILPNPRFPDMRGLADYVHGKGLRIGLYSSPGPWTCGGCVGSFDHELLDAEQYADWGFDYLKYDWCSYSPELESHRGDTNFVTSGAKHWSNAPDRDELMKPYGIMHEALARQSRDILFSLCQYGMGNVWEWGAQVGGNSWRTTGDIRDTWSSMSHIGFSQNGHEAFAGPGHFNDPDMLVVGKVGWGNNLHSTGLTPNEQYTHISLWCLLSAPLLIGCDMTQLDPFTLSLLTNDEVLDVDQDPLGRQAGRVLQAGTREVWAKDLEDGSKAAGLFNRGDEVDEITLKWSDLGLKGPQNVRDLWRQTDLGLYNSEFKISVPRHGVVLVKIHQAS